MRIKILGCSGSELPGHNLTAFLVDGFLLVDAGTIGQSLGNAEQKKISHILITHTHMDHIKGIPFLVDNKVNNHLKSHVTIISGRDVLHDMKKNIFNNKIWPDFTRILAKKDPVMRYQAIPQKSYLQVKGYRIYAIKVNHTVPAYGYIIENSSGSSFAYTGDTGPTDEFWKRINQHNVKVLMVEVSFPNAMKKMALLSKHLTPSLLAHEIKKMTRVPEKIYITHIKPHYRDIIKAELKKLKCPSMEMLTDNTVISLS